MAFARRSVAEGVAKPGPRVGPLLAGEEFEDARDFAFSAIDRSLLDTGRWTGSSSIGTMSGSHTTPRWTRD
jgi:hypothetical protein